MSYSVLLADSDREKLAITRDELVNRELHVITTDNFQDACKWLKYDGTIHVVLAEGELESSPDNKALVTGETIFKTFMQLRYEVNLFLYSDQKDIRRFSFGGLLSGYFYKGEYVFGDMARKIKAEVQNKNRAPFYEALVNYVNKAKDSWHTPGHASGDSVKNSPYVKDYFDFFGENLFTSDVSVSVPELDSLLHPGGVIKEAEELAARAFNARYTFFSTNGTSTSNKIILQTLLKPGDAILLDRNCHKSMHYGMILAGADPVYIAPSVNNTYGVFGPMPKQRIIEEMDNAINAGKNLKAIVITNCTYDGLIYDIKDIVSEAHKRNVKVMVDEAWFGYAIFHRQFAASSAMSAGADYATQSTHKTMSAFSQASMIHVNDPDFEDFEDFFMENFNMHSSTSPQYPMIASIDVATRQMVMEGYSLLQHVLELSDLLRKSVNSLEKFRVLEKDDLITEEIQNDNIDLDPLKITIDVSKSGYTGKQIEHILLSKHNIQVEKTTFNTITVLLTVSATYSRINRLYLALGSIEKRAGNRRISKADKVLKNFRLTLSPIKFRPRFAFYADTEQLPLRNVNNRIAARIITPYPPGIPLLVPGQLITTEIINALLMYKDFGVEIHGMSNGTISVMAKEEEKQLENAG